MPDFYDDLRFDDLADQTKKLLAELAPDDGLTAPDDVPEAPDDADDPAGRPDRPRRAPARSAATAATRRCSTG